MVKILVGCIVLAAAVARWIAFATWRERQRAVYRRKRKAYNDELSREWRLRDWLFGGSATRRLTHQPRRDD